MLMAALSTDQQVEGSKSNTKSNTLTSRATAVTQVILAIIKVGLQCHLAHS